MSIREGYREDMPFERERRIHELLSQETRHLILQFILGHPNHMPSLTELDYMIPKSQGAISDQLERLVGEGVIDVYEYGPNESTRDIPSKFYSLTERGVEILSKYGYLKGVPMLKAVYNHTEKTWQVERHEEAPRPDLPEKVLHAIESGTSREGEQLLSIVGQEVSEKPQYTESLGPMGSEVVQQAGIN